MLEKEEVHCCDLHEGGGNKYDCKVTAYIFRLPESLGLPIVVCCQLTILHFLLNLENHKVNLAIFM